MGVSENGGYPQMALFRGAHDENPSNLGKFGVWGSEWGGPNRSWALEKRPCVGSATWLGDGASWLWGFSWKRRRCEKISQFSGYQTWLTLINIVSSKQAMIFWFADSATKTWLPTDSAIFLGPWGSSLTSVVSLWARSPSWVMNRLRCWMVSKARKTHPVQIMRVVPFRPCFGLIFLRRH